MKKIFMVMALVFLLLLCLAACGDDATYSVIFVVDGSVYYEISIPDGGTLNMPPDPSKDGYVFDGWYAGTVEWRSGAAVSRNVTLTAHWRELNENDEESLPSQGSGSSSDEVNGTDAPSAGGIGSDTGSADENEDAYPDTGKDTDTNDAHTHKGTLWVTGAEATCTSEGFRYIACEICDEALITETLKIIDHIYECRIIEPTCTQKGQSIYTCAMCADTYIGAEIEATGHSYIKLVTAPTCGEGGYTEYICSVCDNSYISDYTNKESHGFGNWYTVSAASCTYRGSLRRDCKACGYYDVIETEALGHNYNYIDGACAACGAYPYSEFSYIMNDAEDGYTLSSVLELEAGIAIIPSEYDGLPVTAIGDLAFFENTEVKTVVFGESIVTVGVSAFENCTNLKSVVFSSGLKYIGERAFFNCVNIVDIKLTSAVEYIDYFAFGYCSGIKEIFIPASVDFIGAFAFLGCSSVTVAEFEVVEYWYAYEYVGGPECVLLDLTDSYETAVMITSYAEGLSNLYWLRRDLNIIYVNK